jgi:hypothetical protein
MIRCRRFVTGPKSDELPSRIFNAMLLFVNLTWSFIILPIILHEEIYVEGILVKKHWFYSMVLPVFLSFLGLANHTMTLIC